MTSPSGAFSVLPPEQLLYLLEMLSSRDLSVMEWSSSYFRELVQGAGLWARRNEDYGSLTMPVLKKMAKSRVRWIKASYLRKIDLVMLLRSRDSLVTSGQAMVGLPGRFTSMKVDQLKGELKAKKVDWLKSSGSKKADLVALVDSMTLGGWQPSKRKPSQGFWRHDVGCGCYLCRLA